MRVLVVEDENKTASFLRKGLSEQGYVVDVADDGNIGLKLALSEMYDVLILDIMLPGRDGLSILSALRKQKINTPVLFLTAKDTVNDRVEGLELGADDYLVKPFSFSELVARLRTILRRGPNSEQNSVQIDDLKIDVIQHRVTRGKQKIELTPKEFIILLLMARRPGQVFSRSIIADQVWGMDFESGTNFVDVHIRRLRSKLDDPFEKKLIRTIRGVGYVIDENP